MAATWLFIPQCQSITDTMEKVWETRYAYESAQVPILLHFCTYIILSILSRTDQIRAGTWWQRHGKVEVLNPFFTLVFTGKTDIPLFQALEASRTFWSKKDILLVKEDHIRELLNKLDIYKCMQPDRTHPLVLPWLLSLPLSDCHDLNHLWKVVAVGGAFPEDWKKTSVTLVFRKDMKDDPRNLKWPASAQSLGVWWNKSSWKPLWDTGTRRRWSKG